jgi:NAD(P)-dependent dehydrogenase (short-subunit alcohol dehydrogenase family)
MDPPSPNRNSEIALVTGGYKNIGLEISRALVNEGYQVISTYRSDKETAIENSKKYGFEVLCADMSEEGQVKDLFSKIRKEGKRISVLVNNVSSFPRGPLLELDSSEFREAFESCVYSTFYSVKEAVFDMRSIGRGSIINIGMAGITEIKGYVGVAAHASAKTALAVLTLSLGKELEDDDITVDMVGPGIVDDPERDNSWRERMMKISPSGRLVSRSEISDAVTRLLRDRKTGGRIVEIQ